MATGVPSVRLCARRASSLVSSIRPAQSPRQAFASVRGYAISPPSRQGKQTGGDGPDGNGPNSEPRGLSVRNDRSQVLAVDGMDDGDNKKKKGRPRTLNEAINQRIDREFKQDPRETRQAIQKSLASKGLVSGGKQAGFKRWVNPDEEIDRDLWTGDDEEEDTFDEDDILSMAHYKLEEHREYREYARIIAWEMPLLSQLAKEYKPPAPGQVLRFRHTSYLGEYHPAERKVVVEFCPNDIPFLLDWQSEKLKKLAGVRYNPERNIIKMSCESFEHAAQNKRRLGDLVKGLILEAQDPSDKFEDVPLDLRHHQVKVKPKFPREWRMTDERSNSIQSHRKDMAKLDKGLINGDRVVSRSYGNNKEPTYLPTGGKIPNLKPTSVEELKTPVMIPAKH